MTLPQIMTLSSVAALILGGGLWLGTLQSRIADDDREIATLRTKVSTLEAEVSALRSGQSNILRRFDTLDRRMLSKGIGDPRRPYTARPPG